MADIIDILIRKGLNYAANALLDTYGMQPQPGTVNGPPQPVTPELADIPGLLRLKSMDGAVVLLIGRPFTGKTIAAQRIAEIVDRPTYAVSPHQVPPKWIIPLQFEEILEKPPPYSTLILDDALTYFSGKDWQKPLIRAVERIFPTIRHERKLFLIVCTQVTSLLDKYGLRADIALFKPADNLYFDIERPGIKRTYDRISYVWEGKSEQWVHRHGYIITHDWQGVVRILKPSRMGLSANTRVNTPTQPPS